MESKIEPNAIAREMNVQANGWLAKAGAG